MIYLASPYTGSRGEMDHRYEAMLSVVADMTRVGLVVYSPIVHFHPVSIKHQLPGDFDFWKRINFWMLGCADILNVVMLEGWDKSKGVAGEIAYAKELDLLIEYMEPDVWQR